MSHFILTEDDCLNIGVCENLDDKVSRYIHQWLELSISATVSNTFLSTTKFGFNVQLPSTKFAHCQVTLRDSLKFSTNQEIKDLLKWKSSNMNVQYDT